MSMAARRARGAVLGGGGGGDRLQGAAELPDHDGVEAVEVGEVVGVGGAVVVVHRVTSPLSAARPRWIWDFTVPVGMSSTAAMSSTFRSR